MTGFFTRLAVAIIVASFATGYPLAQTTLDSGQLPETIIRVDASKPLSFKIPRTIFGSFLEPIGNSTYGGLVAEVLQNPSFEEGLWDAAHSKQILADEPSLVRASELGLPLPWEPLHYAQGNRYESRSNDAANSYRSIYVMGLPDKEVGIRQRVYLPVRRTLHYRGSIYVKYVSGSDHIDVSLRRRNRQETIFVHSTIQISGKDWKRYEFSLDLPEKKVAVLEPVDFAVAVGFEGRVLLDQVSLLPADNIDGMDPEIIAMAKALRSPLVRFGGNFTSAYHWLDGIGSPDKRYSMKNMAWGIPEYNTFGTDEFLRFCELIGARPQIALNLGSGTPDEAAAWVQHANERWGDRSGGLLWELGNELWGTFQTGYPTLQDVAHRTRLFGDAVHRVDPGAVLIATGADEDFYHDWNAAQLGNSSGFRYISTHFVVRTNEVVRKNPTADFLAEANFALPVGLERKLHEMYEQIQSVAGARDKVKIAFTEWLFGGEDQEGPRYDNMGGAIETAGFLNMLMRVSDIVPISDMTGTIYFGGIWKERGQVFGVPSYWAFRMYSSADASQPVEIVANSAKYDVEDGSTRLPNISDVPYLDVVAALNDSGDILSLFCVNRDLTGDIATKISIQGFEPAEGPTAQVLFATSIFEKNDELTPEAVIPTQKSVKLDGSVLEFTFRHESVSVLTMHRKK